MSDELLNIKELQKLGHHVSIATADVAQYIVDMKKDTGQDKFLFQEDKPVEIFGIPVYILHCTIH
ncbi:MAG: hypothetical protein KGL95_09340, partial [Patescibacteria group bacterium]|nr:hypothetical protein [Patescibacteria group bacterium]